MGAVRGSIDLAREVKTKTQGVLFGARREEQGARWARGARQARVMREDPERGSKEHKELDTNQVQVRTGTARNEELGAGKGRGQITHKLVAERSSVMIIKPRDLEYTREEGGEKGERLGVSRARRKS